MEDLVIIMLLGFCQNAPGIYARKHQSASATQMGFFFIYFLSFNAQVGNLRCDHRSGSQTLTPHSQAVQLLSRAERLADAVTPRM